MELSACIVVYNGCDEALKAAQTVLQYTRRHPLTLYLVDNASPDGSGARLEAAVKGGALSTQPGQKVEVRCRKENGGFGTGHNTVLPELTSDYHFILNPDIQLTADTLSDLADWMAEHPDAVMARPGLRFPDGRSQSLPLRRCALRPMVYRQLPFLKFWEKYNRAYLMEGEDLSAPVEIEFCTGSFSAVRTAEFKAVGGFDEHYFMYVEDADLTQKMRTTGKAYLVPQYTAIHAWHRAAHRSLKPFCGRPGACCGISTSGGSSSEPLLMKQKSALRKNFCGGRSFLAFFRFDSRIRCNTIASLPVVHSEILPARVARGSPAAGGVLPPTLFTADAAPL